MTKFIDPLEHAALCRYYYDKYVFEANKCMSYDHDTTRYCWDKYMYYLNLCNEQGIDPFKEEDDSNV